MTRKLSILILILVLAMVFSGCCRHEEWTEANCTTPKTCVECGEIEGAALGHIWIPRTTEIPETCTRCGETRGERIITDSRFTTASTIEYYGTWKGASSISGTLIAEGLEAVMPVEITIVLNNDSTMRIDIIGNDTEAFLKSAEAFLHNRLKEEAAGLTQFTFAEYMAIVYEMTPDQYVEKQLKALDLTALTEGHTMDGVYYIEGDQIYLGLGWEADLTSFPFQRNGGTLVIHGDICGLGQEVSNLSHISD